MRDTSDDRDGDGHGSNTERPRADDGADGDGEWTLAAQRPYEPRSTDGLTTTIVSAVADAEDVPPRDVKRPPLYDVVDTAALETAFFGGGVPSGDVRCLTEFEYRGYRVVVRSDGWVLVHEPRER